MERRGQQRPRRTRSNHGLDDQLPHRDARYDPRRRVPRGRLRALERPAGGRRGRPRSGPRGLRRSRPGPRSTTRGVVQRFAPAPCRDRLPHAHAGAFQAEPRRTGGRRFAATPRRRAVYLHERQLDRGDRVPGGRRPPAGRRPQVATGRGREVPFTADHLGASAAPRRSARRRLRGLRGRPPPDEQSAVVILQQCGRIDVPAGATPRGAAGPGTLVVEGSSSQHTRRPHLKRRQGGRGGVASRWSATCLSDLHALRGEGNVTVGTPGAGRRRPRTAASRTPTSTASTSPTWSASRAGPRVRRAGHPRAAPTRRIPHEPRRGTLREQLLGAGPHLSDDHPGARPRAGAAAGRRLSASTAADPRARSAVAGRDRRMLGRDERRATSSADGQGQAGTGGGSDPARGRRRGDACGGGVRAAARHRESEDAAGGGVSAPAPRQVALSSLPAQRREMTPPARAQRETDAAPASIVRSRRAPRPPADSGRQWSDRATPADHQRQFGTPVV